MSVTQTVEVPASRRLTIDMPPEITETMLLSETSLSKDWDMPEEDEAWVNL